MCGAFSLIKVWNWLGQSRIHTLIKALSLRDIAG
jgi:hypothetical protein